MNSATISELTCAIYDKTLITCALPSPISLYLACNLYFSFQEPHIKGSCYAAENSATTIQTPPVPRRHCIYCSFTYSLFSRPSESRRITAEKYKGVQRPTEFPSPLQTCCPFFEEDCLRTHTDSGYHRAKSGGIKSS